MRILLAEDDVMTAQGVCVALKTANIIVDCATLGQECLEMVHHYNYDAIVISLRLPDMDGTEVVRQLRKAKHQTPVLVLAGPTSAQMKIEAFGAGADDLQAKPLDHDELVARLKVIVRRSEGRGPPVFRIGKLRIDFHNGEVTVDGIDLRLTRKEFAIFELLVKKKEQVLGKDVFLNHLYRQRHEPVVGSIEVFIYQLRKKLKKAGISDCITNVNGVGYAFHANSVGTATAACTVLAAKNAFVLAA